MKQDLVTTIFTAIAGVAIAYFVCNMIIPEIPKFEYKTLSTELTYDLQEPNPEVFNFRAINPTVEVYVGQCVQFDKNGNCIDNIETTVDPNQSDIEELFPESEQEQPDLETNTNTDSSSDQSNNSTDSSGSQNGSTN